MVVAMAFLVVLIKEVLLQVGRMRLSYRICLIYLSIFYSCLPSDGGNYGYLPPSVANHKLVSVMVHGKRMKMQNA